MPRQSRVQIATPLHAMVTRLDSFDDARAFTRRRAELQRFNFWLSGVEANVYFCSTHQSMPQCPASQIASPSRHGAFTTLQFRLSIPGNIYRLRMNYMSLIADVSDSGVRATLLPIQRHSPASFYYRFRRICITAHTIITCQHTRIYCTRSCFTSPRVLNARRRPRMFSRSTSEHLPPIHTKYLLLALAACRVT